MAHKIHIDTEVYEIPDRLTVEQYAQVLAYDWQDPKWYPMILSQVSGAPAEVLMEVPTDSLSLGMSLVIALVNQREECPITQFTDLTFGQFIDLDVWLSMGLDKHLQSIAEIIAPEADGAAQVMWAIDKFAEFRIYTYRQYSALFGLSEREIDQAIDEGHTTADKLYLARSWYKVIVTLAGDDILNIDQVTDQPLTKALNFMAYQKERILETQQKQREQRQKNDLLRHR